MVVVVVVVTEANMHKILKAQNLRPEILGPPTLNPLKHLMYRYLFGCYVW